MLFLYGERWRAHLHSACCKILFNLLRSLSILELCINLVLVWCIWQISKAYHLVQGEKALNKLWDDFLLSLFYKWHSRWHWSSCQRLQYPWSHLSYRSFPVELLLKVSSQVDLHYVLCGWKIIKPVDLLFHLPVYLAGVINLKK